MIITLYVKHAFFIFVKYIQYIYISDMYNLKRAHTFTNHFYSL